MVRVSCYQALDSLGRQFRVLLMVAVNQVALRSGCPRSKATTLGSPSAAVAFQWRSAIYVIPLGAGLISITGLCLSLTSRGRPAARCTTPEVPTTSSASHS